MTDPDSRRMKGNRRYIQGYNAQAVVNEHQIVIAAEISTAAGDFPHLAADDRLRWVSSSRRVTPRSRRSRSR